ncbi:hypothetical protein O6H91_06G078400 [Diphasiastrum complanatum]|uniref:Uncharacterized protein n=2 Tax=Diphasiastrum complanatum TaxID=34168 RepID=A0ACC2DF57_DIPCM|nr:hypothetical protein O6H91_06G078400 [Diphasiastrum complanatum]KAJ7552959.1 hypothetical protein O6H91_06G078400 [Diphasiastrum complanatum]
MDEEHAGTSAPSVSTEDDDLLLLEAVMEAYADKWDASTMNLLITDVASLGKETLPENWSSRIARMKSELLFPLVKILAMEKSRIEQERNAFFKKEQQVISTILTLQEERNNAMQQFEEESDMLARQNMFVETLLRDLDEMAQTVDSYRQTVKELQHALVDKDLEIEQLLADKQELVRRAITTGPKAVVEWVKAELLAQGQEVGESFEQQWSGWGALSETTVDKEMETMSVECADCDQKLTPFKSKVYSPRMISSSVKGIKGKSSLAQVLLVGIYREALSSLNQVMDSGLSAVPFALLDFWGGLIGHVTNHVSNIVLGKVRESPLGFSFKFL